jgi:hypothetical protein
MEMPSVNPAYVGQLASLSILHIAQYAFVCLQSFISHL